jgi:transposase
MKVYSTMSARRFMGDLEEARDNGYISRIPHFNSVLNFFDSENAVAVLSDFVRMSAAPLAEVEQDFAVDSTGFSSHRYVTWFDEKWGRASRKSDWVKVHAIIGVRTNVVAAAEIPDDRDIHDTKFFPGLVKTAAEQFTIREISADKAYCSAKNFDVVEAVKGQFFPAFKSNATGAKGGAYAKAFHMFAMNREEYGLHYHKRSNIESTFSAIKRRFGEAVRSKTDLAMKCEAFAKLVCHNICCLIAAIYELGISPVLGCINTAEAPQILRLPLA